VYKDHEGNQFRTKGEMCDHWKITHSRFNNNLKKGMTLEEALTAPKMSPSQAGKLGRDASGWGRGNEILIGNKEKNHASNSSK